MKYVYFVDVQKGEDSRKNQKVFQLVMDFEIPDCNVFADDDPTNSREEFENLLDTLEPEDTLIIRSVQDIASDFNELCNEIFPVLSEKEVELFSCEEPFLCGTEYLETMESIIGLLQVFANHKKRNGYERALKEQRVGRPSKIEDVVKAAKLYESGNYKVSQIESLTGVSKSTLYRYLKEQ